MSERVRQAADSRAHPRRGLWLWLAIAALLVVAFGFALTRCGGPDPAGTAPPVAPAAPPSAPAAAPPGTAAPTPAPSGPGRLTAGEAVLLPVGRAVNGDARLAAQVDQDVTAEAVLVESVPADEGFWIGTGVTDRIWVQLEGPGESREMVQPGDRVSFTGRLVANEPGFLAESGLQPVDGADQLERQGAHVVVPQAQLRVSGA